MRQKELNWKKRNEKRLNNVVIYLKPSYLIKWLGMIMTTYNIEINKIIIGAFLGAVYSVVLIAPLSLMMNNDNGLKIFFFPITIIIGFAIIVRSLTLTSSRTVAGGKIKEIINRRISVVDFYLIEAIIVATLLMAYFNIIDFFNAFMWILGIITILFLQRYAILNLLYETKGEDNLGTN